MQAIEQTNKSPKSKSTYLAMLGSYARVTLRNLRKEKIHSAINIIGLSVGLASAMVIIMFIRFELSFDQFHANFKNIYRIGEEVEGDGQRERSAMTHSPVYEILSGNLSGIKHVTRILPQSAVISSNPSNKYKEDKFCFADSSFFKIFSFEAIAGSLENALDDPNAVVITEQMANKYFGASQVVGKEIRFDGEEDSYSFNVTAVIRDIPSNSHFHFNFMASIKSLNEILPWYNNWHYPPMFVYFQAVNDFEPEINSFIKRHLPEELKEENRNFLIQPLKEIHLHSNLEFEWEANSDYKYLGIFGALGGFILLIACINFMNMTTAQSYKRAKEIGIRKVIGSSTAQIRLQFLCETMLYVLIAFVVSILLAQLCFTYLLNGIAHTQLAVTSLLTWSNWPIVMAFLIIVSLISGIYPAIYLSKITPFQGGAGHEGKPGSQSGVRKSLVTFQLIVTCSMIFATLIITSQAEYFNTKHLGFEKDHLVAIQLGDRFSQINYVKLKNQLLAESKVTHVCLSSAIPSQGIFHGFSAKVDDGSMANEFSIKTLGVDEDFISTYEIAILEGRDFSKDILSDQTEAFIINEAAASKFGLKNPVGKDFELTVYTDVASQRKGKIIGLIDDFNFQSLYSRVEPLVLYINKHPYYAEFLTVRLQAGNPGNSVATLTKVWHSFNSERPLQYQFINESLNQLYQKEERTARIISILTVVSLIISSLGLFALSSYTASKRTKEMSIRRIFGANISSLAIIQFNEYAIIIALANVIAFPFCWYWADHWLSGFTYPIDLNPGLFLIASFSSLFLTVLTVSYHTLRLAYKNPIQTIRND